MLWDQFTEKKRKNVPNPVWQEMESCLPFAGMKENKLLKKSQ